MRKKFANRERTIKYHFPNISRAVMRGRIHPILSRETCSALSVRCNSLEHHRNRQRRRRRRRCNLTRLFSAFFLFREIGVISNSLVFLSGSRRHNLLYNWPLYKYDRYTRAVSQHPCGTISTTRRPDCLQRRVATVITARERRVNL